MESNKKKHVVIGSAGEVGKAIAKILKEKKDVISYDKALSKTIPEVSNAYILHICIPFCDSFIKDVVEYVRLFDPKFTVIHSTVPVGVTELIGLSIGDSFVSHSPIRGKHPNLAPEILKYTKYFSFDDIDNVKKMEEVIRDIEECGLTCELVHGTKVTELGKLLELARYGVSLAFAKEQEKICKRYGVAYDNVVSNFVETMNDNIDPELSYPELYPFEKYVGGHCVVENMELLSRQLAMDGVNAPVLGTSLFIDKGTVVWGDSNIYPTARLGKGVSVGRSCEIGNKVTVGDGTRIGYGTFIPEGVTIGKDVFIGPGVYFSNDLYPPSKKQNWGYTTVGDNASIGLGSVILPGISIGEGAVIGAGSTVTKDIAAGDKVYGIAASCHGKRTDCYSMEDREFGKKHEK